MLGSRQQTWIVVDIGGRWIKCVRYVIQQGSVREAGSQLIDIQTEGLLSSEEIGVAIRRALHSAGEHPLAVVLPQDLAISQVMDLPAPSVIDRSSEFEDEILELTGLSAGRCVYDRNPLEPFGGYASPQWITVAKEENLSRHLSPLLGQGLHVEAATTVGNALVASFRQTHPGVADACLADIGAKQTTVVRLKRGEPVQMTSFSYGGESWTEALCEHCREGFEEVEARLFKEDLFTEPVLGPVLHGVVEAWRARLVGQIDEWREEFGMPEDAGAGSGGIYLFGGYSAVRGLRETLGQAGGLSWHMPQSPVGESAPVWTPTHGAVLMAAGLSGLRASILPQALTKMRQRRLTLARLKAGVLYLYVFVAMVLFGAIYKQQHHLDGLVAANREARSALSEIEAAKDLLTQRDQLARQIEPVVRGQLNSLDSLQTFRKIQHLHQDFDFTLIRFADRRTYFRKMDDWSEPVGAAEVERPNGTVSSDGSSRAFVVELALPGGQAERLQTLSAIVGRLREETYFANVDRLIGGPESNGAANGLSSEGEAYALLLTLAEAPLSASRGAEEGAGR